jgi:hypothetical protein
MPALLPCLKKIRVVHSADQKQHWFSQCGVQHTDESERDGEITVLGQLLHDMARMDCIAVQG